MRDPCLGSIGSSPGVTQHCASVNVMNDIEYSSFISLVAKNLRIDNSGWLS